MSSDTRAVGNRYRFAAAASLPPTCWKPACSSSVSALSVQILTPVCRCVYTLSYTLSWSRLAFSLHLSSLLSFVSSLPCPSLPPALPPAHHASTIPPADAQMKTPTGAVAVRLLMNIPVRCMHSLFVGRCTLCLYSVSYTEGCEYKPYLCEIHTLFARRTLQRGACVPYREGWPVWASTSVSERWGERSVLPPCEASL